MITGKRKQKAKNLLLGWFMFAFIVYLTRPYFLISIAIFQFGYFN